MKKSNRYIYNDILYTTNPFFLSLCLTFLILSVMLYLYKFDCCKYFFSFSILCFLFSLFCWIDSIFVDSEHGRYNSKVNKSLFVGFFLFLSTEFLLFSGFFWVFFDRSFILPSVEDGFVFTHLSIERLVWLKEPFLGTFYLILSGYLANLSYYFFRSGEFTVGNGLLQFSIFSGVSFLAIQILEYNELNIDICDNVFTSLFFLLTSFHGIHVLIGLFLLNLSLIFDYRVIFSSVPVLFMDIDKEDVSFT